MQTLSSARRTAMASASAVECTTTVEMPISRQARWMRSAISPRLAIRTFSNMGRGLLDHQKDFAELHRLGILRSEEHTSELKSLMRNSYAVFSLKKQKIKKSIKSYKDIS